MATIEFVLAVIGLAGMAAAGALMLAVGVYLLTRVVHDGRAATAKAHGRVVGHEVKESDEDTFYYPLVEFESAGQFHKFKGQIGRNFRPQHSVGKLVEVWFPPAAPEKAQLGRWQGWWTAAGLTVAGGGFFLATLVTAIRWVVGA